MQMMPRRPALSSPRRPAGPWNRPDPLNQCSWLYISESTRSAPRSSDSALAQSDRSSLAWPESASAVIGDGEGVHVVPGDEDGPGGRRRVAGAHRHRPAGTRRRCAEARQPRLRPRRRARIRHILPQVAGLRRRSVSAHCHRYFSLPLLF
jgi:hypothetical protein